MQDVLPQQQAIRDISAVLGSNEKLIWAGKPLGGFRLHGSDWGAIPFSMLWAGFMVFWNYQVWMIPDKGNSAPSRFFGIPFLLMGVHVTVGRFFVEAFVRRSTIYGISSERVIVISKFPLHRVHSQNLAQLNNTTLMQRADGSGDILFDNPETMKRGMFRGARDGAQFFGVYPVLGRLIDIPNVIEAHDSLQGAIAALRSGARQATN